MEELIAVEIRHTAEDRAFFAAKAKQPVWNPVQTVSLLYQAAQAEDAETFHTMSGGGEGYFSGQYERDMVEFTEWMKSLKAFGICPSNRFRARISQTVIAKSMMNALATVGSSLWPGTSG